ncbi:tRNA lysidine(34) synthetase TilS [Novipirellula maiorica]|uniref:tRNA lysidine(34) synthetase TilS n=1 Tax=Novipirellula maiorica TaxID=1265734 RepID=UPI001360B537|nr:tRNA lysidine(34) synthetase TilS [Rhodopirellula maiorica]
MTASEPHSEIWDRLCQSVLRAWPRSRWSGVGVVIGCSGGADSVALVRALHHLRHQPSSDPPTGFLTLAHFNHATRGEESDHDETFVRALADQLELPFVGQRSDQTDLRDEESLRKMRLRFLKETAEQQGARYVAVAHSSDDNVETVLHHLLRGTGPTGLAGIRPYRSLGQDAVLIRPLLSVSRDCIRTALRSIEQSWCEDSSNTSRDYRRNWIRHELIPLIQSKYPDATEAISRAAVTQRDWVRSIESMAEDWRTQHVDVGDAVVIHCDVETDAPVIITAMQQLWSIQAWPMQSMSQTHWQRIYQFVSATQTGVCMLPGAIRMESADGCVVLKCGG